MRLGIDIRGPVAFHSPSTENPDQLAIAGGFWVYMQDLAAHFHKRGGEVFLVAKDDYYYSMGAITRFIAERAEHATPGLHPNFIIVDDVTLAAAGYKFTHFVSSSTQLLRQLESQATIRILFGEQEDSHLRWVDEERKAGKSVLHAADWAQATQQIKWPEQYLPVRTA